MNLRIVTSILPVATFYLLTRIAEPWVAILGGFAVSSAVFYINRKDRLIGMLTVFGFLVVAASSAVGIIYGNEKAYLASGPISDFLFVPLFLGSILVGRPLIGGIARELFPLIAGPIPAKAPVFVWLSVAWAIWNLVHGIIRIFMLQELSIGEYIIWSRVAFWPFGAVLTGSSAWLILRESRRHQPAARQPAHGEWATERPAATS